MESTPNGTVLEEDFQEGKIEQHWYKDAVPNTEGYFTLLETIGKYRLLTANISSNILEMKGNFGFCVKSRVEKSGVETSGVVLSFKLIVRGHFNPGLFNHELSNPRLFNHEFFNPRLFMVEKSGVERSGVEMSSHY